MEFASALLLGGMVSAIGVMIFIIAADKTRYIVRYDLSMWRDRYYLQALPNFLQALYDDHFKAPWPAHCDAVAARLFTVRVRRILRRRPSLLKRNFLMHHLTLFVLLEKLGPFINDFILNEQQRIVGACIGGMEDTIDRDRLLAFLDFTRERRLAFFRSLTSYDRAILAEIIDRRFFPTLRTAHAIFQEHGFSLMPELSAVRRWESLSGTDLAQEIPECREFRRMRSPISGEPVGENGGLRMIDEDEAADND